MNWAARHLSDRLDELAKFAHRQDGELMKVVATVLYLLAELVVTPSREDLDEAAEVLRPLVDELYAGALARESIRAAQQRQPELWESISQAVQHERR